MKESKFKEHGRITPGMKMNEGYTLIVSNGLAEEFVAAGDFLTYKFPVWTWYLVKASSNHVRCLITSV